MWSCPGCGAQIQSKFDGEFTSFTYGGVEYSRCGGIYESVEVTCPKCGGTVIFAKDELEGEVV
jgi:endogenous inhibitor of DNA gyrase (YacG/DUF329 family)